MGCREGCKVDYKGYSIGFELAGWNLKWAKGNIHIYIYIYCVVNNIFLEGRAFELGIGHNVIFGLDELAPGGVSLDSCSAEWFCEDIVLRLFW